MLVAEIHSCRSNGGNGGIGVTLQMRSNFRTISIATIAVRMVRDLRGCLYREGIATQVALTSPRKVLCFETGNATKSATKHPQELSSLLLLLLSSDSSLRISHSHFPDLSVNSPALILSKHSRQYLAKIG